MSENLYLQHHGIKGQKWYLRRFQNEDGTLTEEGRIRYRKDKRTLKTLKRNTAAAKRNLKTVASIHAEEKGQYDEAYDRLSKARSKIYAPWSGAKKRERISEAENELTYATENYKKSAENFGRAKDIYKKSANAYAKKANEMIREYGNDRVSSLKVEQIDVGNEFTLTMIKTGVTVANLPVIGTKYTESYIRQLDYEDRRKSAEKR